MKDDEMNWLDTFLGLGGLGMLFNPLPLRRTTGSIYLAIGT